MRVYGWQRSSDDLRYPKMSAVLYCLFSNMPFSGSLRLHPLAFKVHIFCRRPSWGGISVIWTVKGQKKQSYKHRTQRDELLYTSVHPDLPFFEKKKKNLQPSDLFLEWVSSKFQSPIDWLLDRSIDWLIHWLIDPLIDWLIHWLIDWSIDCSIDWLIDWLIDWFVLLFFHVSGGGLGKKEKNFLTVVFDIQHRQAGQIGVRFWDFRQLIVADVQGGKVWIQ